MYRRIDSVVVQIQMSSLCLYTAVIAGDGASENRRSFKLLANKTTREILQDYYREELLNTLNLDSKIAFAHPNPVYAKTIYIFIGADMLHWVKKFRNAMDNKKTSDLAFNGIGLMLDKFREIYDALNDCKVKGRADVREYKFSVENFELNSYNKMRVFLAMQILSQTMIRMIKDYCMLEEEPVEEWEQVTDVIDRIDRMVDVLNARWDRGAEQIDSPQHKHMFELFSVLQMFEEWKDDVGGFTFEFITRQTYEDL